VKKDEVLICCKDCTNTECSGRLKDQQTSDQKLRASIHEACKTPEGRVKLLKVLLPQKRRKKVGELLTLLKTTTKTAKQITERLRKTPVTTLEMLHALQTRKDGKVLYNICFRNSGVGMTFWEPPSREAGCELLGSACCKLSTKEQTEEWRQYLITERYYPTFEQAVKEEYKRMMKRKPGGVKK